MDRRTLLYLIALTIIFFLMHQVFDFGGWKNEIIHKGPNTIVELTSKEQNPTLLSTNQFVENQIVKLYSDIELINFATYAVAVDNSYLVLAWNTSPPEQLFVQSSQEQVTSVLRLNLRIPANNVGDPILYTPSPISKLRLPLINEETGAFPIYLLYFEGDKAFRIEGTTFGLKKVEFDFQPPKNAIVNLDIPGELGPYGYYDTQTNRIQYFDHIPGFQNYAVLNFPEEKPTLEEYKNQEYYVLENEYQQLVFSNINGALVEINLPFQSEKNTSSVVREIDFDRIIQTDYPILSTFPQNSYYTPEGKGVKKNPQLGGYYPLLRRNFIGSKEALSTKINPHYYAFNLFQEGHGPETNLYTLKRFEKNIIEFELNLGNRRVVKTFSFPDDPHEAPYCINLAIKVEGDARNLLLGLGVPEVELISGSFTPTLKYRITRNQKIKIEEIKPPKALVNFGYLIPDWICDGNGFFGLILDPATKSSPGFSVHPISGELVPTRLAIIDAQYKRFPVEKYPGYEMYLPLPSNPGVYKFRIFAGPFDKKILQTVDTTLSDAYTGYRPDFTAAQSYYGWFAFVSQPFAKFLFFLLDFFQGITHSWGISIILLTIALRIMLYPLNTWSMRSTVKMQHIAPKVQALQEKYKKDPKRVQMEIMNLYRKEGVNPFGGCLPLLIQLPFLFGMFDLLKSSFELRGASFIPGWIDNLTAPDSLFQWKYHIIFIGNSFHLLPILLGIIMYFQQKLMSPGKNTTAVTDQQKQQRSIGNIMTLVFTVLFYHFPSGLNIYWISSTLLGILQQWWITKRLVKAKRVFHN